jgi:hypothetical protein
MCLDNVFMQCFIQCFREDDVNHHSSINKNRLVLDVNVGVCNLSLIPTYFCNTIPTDLYDTVIMLMQTLLNFEEHERHRKTPQSYDQAVLDDYLDKTLPQLDNCVDYKSV